MQMGQWRSGLTTAVMIGGLGTAAHAAPQIMPCSHCLITSGPATPAPLVSKQLPYELSFHSGRSVAGGQTDHFDKRFFGSGQEGFTLETSRRVTKRGYSLDRSGSAREKLSSGSMTLRYEGNVGGDDTLSAGFSGGFEKRRFALDLSNGHMVRSKSIGVEAGWQHGPSLRLSGGYRDDMGSGGRSTVVRGIELAEGAARTQRGPWVGLNFTPEGQAEGRTVSFGIKAQAMQLSSGDRLALGAPTAHDNRIGFTTSIRFR